MGKLVFRVASDWQEVVRLRTEIEKLKQTLLSMDLNQSPDTFKKLNIQLGESSKKLDELVTKAAKAGAVMEGDFKKKIFDASQTVNGFTEKIISQKAVVKDVEADVRRLGDSYRTALKRNPLSASGKLEEYKSAKRALDEEKAALFGLTQQQANARLAVKKLRDEYSLYNNDGKQVIETNKGIGLSLGKALGVIGGIAALKQLGSEIIRVRGEFQSMQTAIETMVGKDVAGKIIPQIKELAKISPLTMTDMVGAEKMMLGFNIQAEDTIKYLKALSDISMGESSKFNSLTLAFSQMSATGRLLGGDLNQMINAGFNPLQVIAEKTGKSIATLKEEMSKGAISAEMVQQAFIDATSAGGKFYGMSENASQTINGQISMMQDAWDNALNEMGQSSEGFIMSGIQATTSLIQNYETVGKVLVGLIATYGTYRTAVITNIALTRGWAVAARADTVAKGLQTIATKAQTIAQLALNSAMKANPYVLAATLITGVVSAMWAFSDSTSEVERRQERLSRVSKDLNTEIGKETKIAKDLFDKLKKAKEGTTEYSDAKQVILDKYGQYLSGMNSEISTLKDQEKAYNAVTDAIKRNVSEKLKEKFINEGVGDSSAKQSEALKMIRESLNKKYTSFADALKGEYNPTKESEEAFNAVKELLAKDDISGASNLLFKDYGLNFMGDAGKGLEQYKNAANEIKQVFKDADDLFSFKKDNSDSVVQSNVSKEIVDVTNKIAKLRKEISDIRSGKVQVEYGKTVESVIESKKKDLQDAEKSLETLTGISSSKQESETEKQRKKQQKLAEELLSIRRQNQQDEIYLMKEGSDKKLKQIELDYQKEIDAIKKQKEKWGKEQEGKLTDEQTNQLGTRASNAAKKREKSITIVNDENLKSQEEAMNEYLLKYGTFTQKKDAIDKKYRDAIEKEADLGKKNSLQKEWDEQLANLDLSKLKDEINWEMIFGDLSKVTKDQLTKIKSQLQEFKKSPEFKNATPEQIQVIEGAINSINNAMVDKGGFFGGMTDSVKELKIATEELKRAEEELAEANKKGTEAEKEEAQKKVNQAKNRQQNAQTNVEKSSDKAIQHLTAVGDAIAQLGSSAEMSLSSFGNAAANIVDAFSEAGSKIGGIIGAIFSILEGIQKQGLDGFVGNIIGNVAGAVGGILDTLTFGAFGLKGADYSGYNEMVAKYDSLLDVWDQLLDKKKAYIKESYGPEATKAGKEALDLLNSERQITKELASSRLDAGKSAGSHSMNYRMWKGSYDYNGQKWKDVAPEISNALGGIDFSSMWSMLNMSSEQLEWIKTNYSGLWAHMDGDFKGYLENIIQYGDTEKEIIESINEQLTQTSFDSLFDGFLNTLMDMDASSKDFADNFEEYMRKAIFTSMFAKNYEGALEEWYKAFAKANDKEGGITAGDVKDLKNQWDDIVNGALADREAWEKIVGSSSESTSQSSTRNGFNAMSQDTGEELNGRFTALQIAGEEVKNQNILQTQSLNILTVKADAILSINTDTRNIADEIRTIQVNSYLELQEIRENTGAIVKPIQQMQKDIAEVKKNTKGLS